MTIEYFAESNRSTRTLPRSVATKAGGFVFVSGQVARGEDGSIVAGGIEAQVRQTLKNVAQVLALAACTLEDVVKTTVWLEDARDFDEFNRVYAGSFQATSLHARLCRRRMWLAPRSRLRPSHTRIEIDDAQLRWDLDHAPLGLSR